MHQQLQLVTVDTASNSVRIINLGSGVLGMSSLYADSGGSWHWLSVARETAAASQRLEAWVFAPGETQPRAVGTAMLEFEPPRDVFAVRGDSCWLFVAAKYTDGDMRELTGFSRVASTDSEFEVHPEPGLRGVRFWHPRERAFVVQAGLAGSQDQLLDCAGNRRAPSATDGSRLDNLRNFADIRISARGDWLYSNPSAMNEDPQYRAHDEITLVRASSQSKFGPFGQLAKSCPDINCIWEADSLRDPQWSGSGDFFLVQGYPRSYVVRTGDLAIMRRWRSESGRAVFVTDSLVMDLSKNRGVTFHRW